jgi:hypothetical protein
LFLQVTDSTPQCRVALISLLGGANGIGRETAILFAQYGYAFHSTYVLKFSLISHRSAKIVIGDINGDAAKKVVEEISALGWYELRDRAFQIPDQSIFIVSPHMSSATFSSGTIR